jgi:hypothetical protein
MSDKGVCNDDDSKSSSSNVLTLIKQTIGNETAQAAIKIFQTPHTLVRLHWIACLLVACSLASFFVIQSLIAFVTFKVNTNTRTIFETSSLFPRVTYCNKNPFTTKYAYEKMVGQNLTYAEMLYEMNYRMGKEERMRLQHPFSKILIECSFNGEKCSVNDFQHEHDVNLGSCYSFNSGFNASGHAQPLKESVRAGSSNGLKLTVYVNYYESLTRYNDYFGSVIKIGNSSHMQVNSGPEIAPSFKTNIIVERVFEEILPRPYSECYMPSDDDMNVSPSSQSWVSFMALRKKLT